VLVAALVSAVVALLALRASGIYFMMITLSISMCGWGLAYRWVSLTGGDTGIVGVARPRLRLTGFAGGGLDFYYVVLACFLVCLALLLLLLGSPFGKTLVGIRDSESRMRVLGFNVWLHKYLALVIAGAFAGVSGSLYAYYNGHGAGHGGPRHSMLFVLMVILGGPGTLVGPVLGAFIITFLDKMMSVFTERWVMVLSAAYVATALWAPRGLLGLVRLSGDRRDDGELQRRAGRGVRGRHPPLRRPRGGERRGPARGPRGAARHPRPNGAGKTTLFRLISGDTAHRGAGAPAGQDITRVPCHRRTLGLGRTFQITNLFRPRPWPITWCWRCSA
jgi:branched-chain amino acid transport system permease protein